MNQQQIDTINSHIPLPSETEAQLLNDISTQLHKLKYNHYTLLAFNSHFSFLEKLTQYTFLFKNGKFYNSGIIVFNNSGLTFIYGKFGFLILSKDLQLEKDSEQLVQ